MRWRRRRSGGGWKHRPPARDGRAEPFEGFDWRPERLAVNGDRVLVSGRMSGQGRGSGVPVAAEEFHVLTLRDARIVRLQMFLDEGEARTAAGLPE